MSRDTYHPPVLPEELVGEFDAQAEYVHHVWQHYDLGDIVKPAGPSHIFITKSHTFNDGTQRQYGVLRRPGDFEHTEAVAIEVPHGHEADKPSMRIYGRLILDLVVPNGRVYIFPGITRNQPGMKLYGEDLAVLARGDFSPIGDRDAEIIGSEGVEELYVEAYSGGTSIAPYVIRAATHTTDVVAANMGEPVNVENRTRKEVKHDFMAGGPGAIVNQLRATHNARLPALDQAQGLRVTGLTRLVRDYTRFGGDAKMLWNLALTDGYGRDTFSEFGLLPAHEASPDTYMSIYAGGLSRMFKPENRQRLINSLDGMDGIDFPVFAASGHEHLNNFFAAALELRRVVRVAREQRAAR